MKIQQEVILGEIKGYKYSGYVCSGFQSQGGSLHLHASSHSGGVCPGVQSQRGCFVICVWWTQGFTSKCNTYQPLVDQHGNLTPHPQTQWEWNSCTMCTADWRSNRLSYLDSVEKWTNRSSRRAGGLLLLYFSSLQIFWLLLFEVMNVASNNWMLSIAKLW